MKFKNQIKAIIFDMDGTILDSEHVWGEAIKSVLTNHNVILNPHHEEVVFKKMSGTSLEACFKQLKEMFNLSKSHIELMEECKKHSASEFAKGVNFIQGFTSFHMQLQSYNIPSCIATNCDPDTFVKIEQRMKLSNFFGNKMFNISHVKNPKPSPELFLYSAEQLNVKPHECVVFEDSLFGFKAAKEAGMKCIGIKNDKNTELLHHVDHAIDNYDFAKEILNKIAMDILENSKKIK
ncbi:TPA: hypothetical protein DEO28_01335 [Candidatus Dependentiae bacterium]|nr:MAG: HAD-superfamily hydrolase, subfamily IA, variant 3 [candidate division TM6 bacterium GW2011_GWE2_31_21]KKP53721.1 MAG: HAD-superfamily hydrolase, subfamily IA, variant 3 [candidate division TM6 bacterium GW2011_GWF2_33_332]HBS48527.1 hypothetical protein [Candidatus Dependentiae bacterium]HBZ73142.1 hypothetical protein [Candidatus Dependentiae bacterium]